MRKITVLALMAVFMVVASAAAVDPSPQPAPPTYTLKVVSPAAGERWVENTTQTVAWTLTPPATPTKVDLVLIVTVKDAVAPKEIVLATFEKDFPEKWVWDKVSPVGNKLKLEVRMQFAKMKPIKASQIFTIAPMETITATPGDVPAIPPKPAGPVTVKSPNGGEIWTVGKTEVIAWVIQPDKPVKTVNIFLSRDGGKTFAEVLGKGIDAMQNQFKYTVAGPASLNCIVKIECSTTEGLPVEFDVSDASFKIKGATETPTPQHQEN